jgi:hypothetical protein
MYFQKLQNVPVRPELIFDYDYIMIRAGSGKQKGGAVFQHPVKTNDAIRSPDGVVCLEGQLTPKLSDSVDAQRVPLGSAVRKNQN